MDSFGSHRMLIYIYTYWEGRKGNKITLTSIATLFLVIYNAIQLIHYYLIDEKTPPQACIRVFLKVQCLVPIAQGGVYVCTNQCPL